MYFSAKGIAVLSYKPSYDPWIYPPGSCQNTFVDQGCWSEMVFLTIKWWFTFVSEIWCLCSVFQTRRLELLQLNASVYIFVTNIISLFSSCPKWSIWSNPRLNICFKTWYPLQTTYIRFEKHGKTYSQTFFDRPNSPYHKKIGTTSWHSSWWLPDYILGKLLKFNI